MGASIAETFHHAGRSIAAATIPITSPGNSRMPARSGSGANAASKPSVAKMTAVSDNGPPRRIRVPKIGLSAHAERLALGAAAAASFEVGTVFEGA